MTYRQVAARHLPGWIVALPVLVALLLGILVYQLPARTTVAIGSLGDQLFLDSSAALDAAPDAAGLWYADELGDGGRSRWTRSRARITFPALGGGATDLALRVQGWPEDVTRTGAGQPVVTVRVDGGSGTGQGTEIGRFTPTSDWHEYRFSVPAGVRDSATLAIELEISATFAGTRQFPDDVRPKGIRIDRVVLETAPRPGLFRAGWTAVLGLAGAALLATLAVRRQTRHAGLAALFGLGVASAGATCLALWRPWAAALMPLLPLLAAAGLLVAGRHDIRRVWRTAGHRIRWSSAPGTGGIVALAGAGLLLAVDALHGADLPGLVELEASTERLVQLLPAAVVAGLLLAAGPTVLPDALRSLRRRLLSGHLTPVLLALAGGVILGWELQLLRDLPFVGHADYADNAVVARSLLRGEGWTVPYVTQFYELVPGGTVYRPQETWPLLQPVWMVPWMALFGPTAFAARIANIVFNLALLLLIYHIGTTLWDRRVGALAAVLTLLNLFFFRLTIYSTTDLGFTVLSMAALWFFFRAWTAAGHSRVQTFHETSLRIWVAAGIATGLMILQKPTGALFGAGMLLWVLLLRWRGKTAPWLGLLLWMGISGLIVLPYIVRNLVLFGRPVFSTESYDAWILAFQGPGEVAWETIYRVYLGDLPNRSWILRWGWDRTFDKVLVQAMEAWAYFFPPRAKLAGAPMTWLALGGLFFARSRQRPLVALVALVGAVYTLFLATYWHANEERYFVAFVPWLALLAMGGLCAAFDRVLHHGSGRWAGLAGGLAVLLLWAILQRELQAIDAHLDPESEGYWGREWIPDREAYAWLRGNTAPDEVVMTRVPWQLSFEADRPSVMIPHAPLVSDDPETPTIMQVARYYGADYLMLNAMQNPKGVAAETLRPLSRGEPILGFTPVYTGTARFGRGPIYIYRFPADYAGAAPLQAEDGS